MLNLCFQLRYFFNINTDFSGIKSIQLQNKITKVLQNIKYMLYHLKKTISRHLSQCKPVRFYFSSYTSPTRILYQTAFLSFQAINTITQPITKQQFTTQSIATKILKQTNNQKEFNQISKNKISQLFKNGVKPNQQLFFQQRFESSLSGTDAQQKKLIFYPTHMITTQIFRLILQRQAQFSYKTIATGHKGISKTLSMALFWYLTKYIDQFCFGLTQEQKNIPQYKQLLQKLSEIPKFFYWPIIPSDDIDRVNKIILKQCPELKDKIKSLQTFQITKLKALYQQVIQNTKIVLGVDHINLVADQYRKKEHINSKTQDQKDQNASKIGFYKRIFLLYVPNFDYCLYLSSMMVQEIPLKQLNLGGDKGQFAVIQKYIDLSKTYYMPMVMYQQASYYLFQIENKIFNSYKTKIQIDEGTTQRIKTICFDYLNKHQYEYFITPLQIRSYVTKMKKIFLLNIPNEEIKIDNDLLGDKIIQQFKAMITQSNLKFSKYIENNLIKNDANDIHRMNLRYELYHLCIDLVEQQLQNINNNKQVQYKIYINQLTIDQQMIDKYVDKNIFFYQQDSNQLILRFPPSFIVTNLQPLINKQLKYYLNANREFLHKYFSLGHFGNLVERIFILCLIRKNVTFRLWIDKINNEYIQFNFNNSGAYGFKPIQQIKQSSNINKKQNQQYTQQLQKSKSNQILQMTKEQINKLNFKSQIHLRRKKKFNFLDGFKFQIQKTIQQKAESRLFLPICSKAFKNIHLLTQNVIIQKLKSNSKLIDFVILNIQKKRMQAIRTIQIWAIDIKTGKKDVRQQLKEFISQFITFQDRNQTIITINGIDYRVQLHFYVFGPTVALYPFLDDFNNIFDGFIKFKKDRNSDICFVKRLDGEQNSLLRSIGYIDVTQNCQFVQPNKDNLNLKMVFEVMRSKQVQRNEQKIDLNHRK